MKYGELLAECDPMQSHWDMNECLLYLERVYDIETVVEIGCYQGGSFAAWSRALLPARLIGITKDEVELTGFPEKLRQADGTMPDVTMVFGLSQEQATYEDVISALDGRKIDFLFIDGGHSWREVQLDFLMYSPLVSEHGVVGIHDVNRGAMDVYRFWEGYIQMGYRHVVVSDAAISSGLGIGLVLGAGDGLSWADKAATYDKAS